jgi:hypothetical protein
VVLLLLAAVAISGQFGLAEQRLDLRLGQRFSVDYYVSHLRVRMCSFVDVWIMQPIAMVSKMYYCMAGMRAVHVCLGSP